MMELLSRCIIYGGLFFFTVVACSHMTGCAVSEEVDRPKRCVEVKEGLVRVDTVRDPGTIYEMRTVCTRWEYL